MIMKDKAAKPVKTRQARYLKDKKGMAQLNCMIDEQIYNNFKSYAYANNSNVKDTLPLALKEYVEKRK